LLIYSLESLIEIEENIKVPFGSVVEAFVCWSCLPLIKRSRSKSNARRRSVAIKRAR